MKYVETFVRGTVSCSFMAIGAVALFIPLVVGSLGNIPKISNHFLLLPYGGLLTFYVGYLLMRKELK